MDTIGYILYAGLGLSVFSFLFLLVGLLSKNKETAAFEENDYEEFNTDFDNDWEEEQTPKRNSLFSVGKKKKTKTEKIDDEYLEEDDDIYEDDEYEEEEYEEDEYEKDFNFAFDEKKFEPKRRNKVNQLELDEYEDEDLNEREKMEIKRYNQEYFEEEEEELSEQEKMLKRIEMYKNKLK